MTPQEQALIDAAMEAASFADVLEVQHGLHDHRNGQHDPFCRAVNAYRAMVKACLDLAGADVVFASVPPNSRGALRAPYHEHLVAAGWTPPALTVADLEQSSAGDTP